MHFASAAELALCVHSAFAPVRFHPKVQSPGNICVKSRLLCPQEDCRKLFIPHRSLASKCRCAT